MASKLLTGWKLVQLKQIAFLTGLPFAGMTKTELISTLIAQTVPVSRGYGGRIVSVDMGIRNLAYCVVDVPKIDARLDAQNASHPLRVMHWRKIDLLKGAENHDAKPGNEQGPEPTSTSGQRRKKRPAASAVPASTFTPSQLSKTAYAVTMDLMKHKPDTILIERQRFRSLGAAAIQEWTVRVNMLESMLWACLQTLRESTTAAGASPIAREVNPARVGSFWTSSPDASLRLTTETLFSGSVTRINTETLESGRKGMLKKDKIAIVRSWLDNAPGSPVTFEGQAAEIAIAFTAPPSRLGRRLKADKEERFGKLDDLADCLLQAAAWVRWEENRAALGKLIACESGQT